jgi:two-component system response regulator ChvI
LLAGLRQAGLNLPVVFLTGYASRAQEHLAFDRGAVDFIDKARGVEILVRRLRRLVGAPKSAAAPASASLVVCGKLVLNPNVSRAYWNDSDVGLTFGEYNIVHLLASNAGQWMTYRAIYDRVHYEGFIGGSGKDGYQANVRGVIKRIRKKFLQFDETFVEIENFVGFGYRWANPTGAG